MPSLHNFYFCPLCQNTLQVHVEGGKRYRDEYTSYTCLLSCPGQTTYDLKNNDNSILSIYMRIPELDIRIHSLASDGKCIGKSITTGNYIFRTEHWNDIELILEPQRLIQKIKLYMVFN